MRNPQLYWILDFNEIFRFPTADQLREPSSLRVSRPSNIPVQSHFYVNIAPPGPMTLTIAHHNHSSLKHSSYHLAKLRGETPSLLHHDTLSLLAYHSSTRSRPGLIAPAKHPPDQDLPSNPPGPAYAPPPPSDQLLPSPIRNAPKHPVPTGNVPARITPPPTPPSPQSCTPTSSGDTHSLSANTAPASTAPPNSGVSGTPSDTAPRRTIPAPVCSSTTRASAAASRTACAASSPRATPALPTDTTDAADDGELGGVHGAAQRSTCHSAWRSERATAATAATSDASSVGRAARGVGVARAAARQATAECRAWARAEAAWTAGGVGAVVQRKRSVARWSAAAGRGDAVGGGGVGWRLGGGMRAAWVVVRAWAASWRAWMRVRSGGRCVVGVQGWELRGVEVVEALECDWEKGSVS
ncbi:hypothetical protein FH972_021864 [Carpinus fangiana]|uniref:Uncharacterized protein n=1 Tax=Carpinus fangiana TaxID=176857 RepID=A0A5N6KR79_9ROSI|nr:hypothetical protein FH972_021864 [Carpinus fangiana]